MISLSAVIYNQWFIFQFHPEPCAWNSGVPLLCVWPGLYICARARWSPAQVNKTELAVISINVCQSILKLSCVWCLCIICGRTDVEISDILRMNRQIWQPEWSRHDCDSEINPTVPLLLSRLICSFWTSLGLEERGCFFSLYTVNPLNESVLPVSVTFERTWSAMLTWWSIHYAWSLPDWK